MDSVTQFPEILTNENSKYFSIMLRFDVYNKSFKEVCHLSHRKSMYRFFWENYEG